MYPVTSVSLPEAYNKLEIPNAIQLDPRDINENKEKWINEWLNAS
jgi:ABC-type thiamine transport system substrate-binding protein